MDNKEAYEIQIEDARTENLVQIRPNKFLATSDFFFKDENFKFVTLADIFGWHFFDKETLNKYEKIHQYTGRKIRNNEELIQKRLSRCLRDEGYKIETEVTTPHGRIDILIKDEPVKIIEIKLNSNIYNLSNALQQLFRYSISYPDAELYFYCPGKISKTIERLLEKRGILIWI